MNERLYVNYGDKVVPTLASEDKNIDSPKATRKVGRPKTKFEPCKTVNISIPESVLADIDIAKAKYKDNLTEYINAIIKKDLAENMKEYRRLYALLK